MTSAYSRSPLQDSLKTFSLAFALLLTATLFQVACLPTYDPDEVSFEGNTPSNTTNTGSGETSNTSDTSGSACESSQEICDGVDNDCDGSVDESFPRQGLPCGNNIGICSGVSICEGGEEVCFQIQEPSDELCDNLDNDCDGQVDELILTDINNCGSCGNVCSFGNGQAGCERGECALIACNSGFADCDGAPSNGCETDTNADPTNCGSCGNICGDDTAETICSAGSCTIQECLGDREDCNAFAADGCEADLEVDILNCGTCGQRCEFDNAQALCLDTQCSFGGCLEGFVDSDLNTENGCEVGLRIIGSPPDASLGNLAVGPGRLFGSANNQLFAYELDAQGSLGPLLLTETLSSPILDVQAGENGEVYVSLQNGDVQILETLDGDAQLTGAAITSGPAPGFTRVGQFLYVADGRDGLKIFNVNDISSPRQVGRAPAPDLVSQVFVFGNRAILGSPSSRTIHLYDVSDPENPTLLASPEAPATFDRAVLRGDLLITGAQNNPNINLHRLSDDGQITFLGQASLPGPLTDFSLAYPFLVNVLRVGSDTVQIALLDIRRPQRPALISSYDAPVNNQPRSAAIVDDHIYVAGNRGLQRFDTRDLRQPTNAQDLVRPQSLRDLRLAGNKLYIASDGAVEVLDITNPANPSRISRFGESIHNVTLSTGKIFVSTDRLSTDNPVPGILRYDIVDPENDESPNVFATPTRPVSITAGRADNTVYALVGNVVQAINMDEPASVTRSLDIGPGCTRIVYDNTPGGTNKLFAACPNAASPGLRVIDPAPVELPTAMTQLQSIPDGGAIYDIDIFGVNIYTVADSGINVHNVDSEGALIWRGLYPLPVSGLRRLTGIGTTMLAASQDAVLLLDRTNQTFPVPLVSRTLSDAQILFLVSSGDFFYAGTSQGLFRLLAETAN